MTALESLDRPLAEVEAQVAQRGPSYNAGAFCWTSSGALIDLAKEGAI